VWKLISSPHHHFITCTNSWYCVKANQQPTPPFYYMHECQNSLIQCFTSTVFVSIPIPWIYSLVLWTTETVQHTSAQYICTVSALILAGIRRPGETQVNNGERPGILSTASLLLPYDQIMTFDCGLSRDYSSGKLFVGVEIIKWVTWYAEALCILCLRVDVHSSLAQGYCYNVICI